MTTTAAIGFANFASLSLFITYKAYAVPPYTSPLTDNERESCTYSYNLKTANCHQIKLIVKVPEPSCRSPTFRNFKQVLTTVFQTSVCYILPYVFKSELQPYIIQLLVKSCFEVLRFPLSIMRTSKPLRLYKV